MKENVTDFSQTSVDQTVSGRESMCKRVPIQSIDRVSKQS